MKELTDKERKYKNWFEIATNERRKHYQYKVECEEFYYNDLKNTLTQFTKKQLKEIEETYNIPISTKTGFAIIQQMISFVTGGQPFPRLIGASDNQADFAKIWGPPYQGTWYESKGNDMLLRTIQDAFVVGEGYMRPRQSDFFQESTFNVIQEYIPWRNVVIDPESKDPYYDDAQYMMIVEVLKKEKAERKYDITINDDDIATGDTILSEFADETISAGNIGYTTSFKETKYVIAKKIFHKEFVITYLSSDGQFLSLKKPKIILVPNEERILLQSQIEQLQQQLEQGTNLQNQYQEQKQIQPEPQLPYSPEDIQTQSQEQDEIQSTVAQTTDNTLQISEQISTLNEQLAIMPEEVSKYEMILENKNKQIVDDIVKIKRMRIKETLIIGDTIEYEIYIPGNRYPISNIFYAKNRSPNKVYGVIHFIQDLIKAMNKSYSLTLLDMSINGQRKVLYWKGTVAEPTQVENRWSHPGCWIEIIYNPTIPDGGKPIIIEPGGLAQASVYMLTQFMNSIEYITGISGVVQGQEAGAPSTFGATQSLQAFGTQRIKLFTRQLEISLENLAYSTICYLQRYAPREKILRYFDENGDQKELQVIEQNEDLEFKTKVEITNNLPTFRQMQVQLIGLVAQQTQNPTLSEVLVKYMLQMMDLPKADEISEQIDIVKQLQSQMQQLQGELDTQTNRNKQLESNMYQQKLSSDVNLAAEKEKSTIKTESALTQNNLDSIVQQAEEQNQNNYVQEEL